MVPTMRRSSLAIQSVIPVSLFKLFFDEMRVEFCRFNNRVPNFDANCVKKHGFFAANQKWFAAIGIEYEESGADRAVLQETAPHREAFQF
jgi:hypothetical protein